MKIVIPELNNSIMREAVAGFPSIEFFDAPDLESAVDYVTSGRADTMLSGLDYSSRDVLLAYKAGIPLKSDYFSSCFICQKGDRILALADGGVNKQPTKEQLLCLIEDTAETFTRFTSAQPRIALLSYSTNGSGGKNPDLDKYRFCIDQVRQHHPDWLIDGEMQLDVAIDPAVAHKKFPDSVIQGDANILITPDLNSGNILYKSLERFGGFTIAGPLIQGFKVPLGDLSRGSTVDDVILTINVLEKLFGE